MAPKDKEAKNKAEQENEVMLKETLSAWQRRGKSFLVAVHQLSKDIDNFGENFHLAPLRCGRDFRQFEAAMKTTEVSYRRFLYQTKRFEKELLLAINNKRKQPQAARSASFQSPNHIDQNLPMEVKSKEEENQNVSLKRKSKEEEKKATLKNLQVRKKRSAAKGSQVQLSSLDEKFIRQNNQILVPHSFGRPRAAMNRLLRENNAHLGPFAFFGQTAIATHGCQVFQLVLAVDWNKFVGSREKNQVLYIGTGTQRERAAEILAKTQEAIPIFYDPRTDSCIHYIGHYVPLLSTVKRFKNRPYNYMGSDRYMRIELKFMYFSEDLAEAIRNGA